MARIQPSFPRVQIGSKIQHQCEGAASWTSSDPGVATIDSSGLTECKGLGATKIAALDRAGQPLGSTWLCVSEGLSPNPVQLQAGEEQTLTSSGNPIAWMQSGNNAVATTSGATISCVGAGFTIVYAFDSSDISLGCVQVFGGALVINPANGGGSYYQLTGEQWLADPVGTLPTDIQTAFQNLRASDYYGGTSVQYTSGLAYCIDLQNVPLDQQAVNPYPCSLGSGSGPVDQTIYVLAADGNYYEIEASVWESDPVSASDYPQAVQTAMGTMITDDECAEYDPPSSEDPSEDTERSAGSDASAIYLNCYLINLQSLQPSS